MITFNAKNLFLSSIIFGNVFFNGIGAIADPQLSDEVRFVAAGIRNAREQDFCMQAVVTATTSFPKEFNEIANAEELNNQPAQDSTQTRMAWWQRKGENLSMVVRPVNVAENDPESILRYQKLVIEPKLLPMEPGLKRPGKGLRHPCSARTDKSGAVRSTGGVAPCRRFQPTGHSLAQPNAIGSNLG